MKNYKEKKNYFAEIVEKNKLNSFKSIFYTFVCFILFMVLLLSFSVNLITIMSHSLVIVTILITILFLILIYITVGIYYTLCVYYIDTLLKNDIIILKRIDGLKNSFKILFIIVIITITINIIGV